mgnify:CR=1 FL=1
MNLQINLILKQFNVKESQNLKQKITLYYDKQCPFCSKYANFLKLKENFEITLKDARENLSEISIIGGILLLATGLNILKVTKIKSLNLLPALIIPIIFFMIRNILGY